MKRFLQILVFGLLPAFGFGQIVKTAAVTYTKGSNPYTVNLAGSSEIRIDTATSVMYWWKRDALTWVRVPYGVDVITGSVAPAYTPQDNQSVFAINADSELWYYNGSTWVQVGGSTGSGGIYGGSGNVPDATVATLADDFEFSGGDISSFTVTTGATQGGQYFSNLSGASVIHRDTSGNSLLAFSGTGANFNFTDGATDRLTITGRDARYAADYSGTFSARSLVDKAYVDGVVPSITATNGLTESPANTIALGGSLTGNTTITGTGFGLTVTAANASTTTLTVANSSTGQALSVTAAGSGNYAGVISNTSTGPAFHALAQSGGVGLVATSLHSSTNTLRSVAYVQRETSGTAANGIGGSLDFNTEVSDGNLFASSRLASRLTNATSANRTSAFALFGLYNGTSDEIGEFKWTTATANTASLAVTNSNTNVGFALAPKGTGALTAHIPEGTSAGGNARGQYAVDWQMLRTNATDVASGNYSTIPGGRRCEASGTYSFATGFRATASGAGSVCFGGSGSFSVGASATGDNSFAMGTGADATATNAVAFNADASAQNAVAIGANADKYYQVSINGMYHLALSALSVGTGTQELFLDASSLRATIGTDKIWVAEVRVCARVLVVGNGTGLTIGDAYAATYKVVIQNIGGTTALVGTVQADMAAQSAASMSGSVFTIAADNTNDALAITYTPNPNEGTTTQTSVYAAIWYNEF